MLKPYYDKNGITIHVGDCLEVMPQLDVTFDAIIADLPYGTTACNWDEVIPFEPLWDNYKRLIKGNGAVVLFGSQPFTSKLVMSNLEWFKYEWIWDKTVPTNFQLANYQPLKSHESLLVFSLAPAVYNKKENHMTYNPQMGVTKKENIRPKINREFVQQNVMRIRSGTHIHKTPVGISYPKSLIEFNRYNGENNPSNKTVHPTQKPVTLLSYLIRTYTNSNEIILDNTMGSGTTLVAAQNEGRRAVGIELDESYCKIAVERLRQPSFFSIPDKPKNGTISEQLRLIDA